jgi:ATP-dependent helicase IRC3
MEKRVIELSEQIKRFKTQKTRFKTIRSFLNDEFDIYKRKDNVTELQELLDKHSLKVFTEGGEIIKLTEIDYPLDTQIRIAYIETNYSISNPENVEVQTEASGKIPVVKGKSPFKPYKHQEKAIEKLNEFYKLNSCKKGLLVLPTGAGKTATAICWLLKNVINNKRKVIWIAHRHELLEQVKKELVKQSFTDLLDNIDDYRFRIISGYKSHHQANRILPNDDFIIASKDSLREGSKFLISNFLSQNKNAFLVIDEAHHAVARTYTELIKVIENHVETLNVLGLTATPYRTAESEKSFLKTVFKDDIIFSEDLGNLITKKILAKPIIVPIQTNEKITNELSEQDKKLILQFSELPENVKNKIGKLKNRNRLIVDTYFNEKDKYKKTIIFALDKDHAIELNSLFNSRENGISKFVISGTTNSQLISLSPTHNKDAVDDFRKNKIQVLINVNILTEGVDLPDAQTIFLTRPTKSKILLTQMIGRGLRGPEANGSEVAYIVSFIDNWDNFVDWVSPKELINDEAIITYNPIEYQKRQLELISIKLIEQFTLMVDNKIDPALSTKIKALDFKQRYPIGWYSFDIEITENIDEPYFKNCKILVFINHYEAYTLLSRDMESLFDEFDFDGNSKLDTGEKQALLKKVKTEYFDNCFPVPAIKEDDLWNFIEFYNQYKLLPPYYTFDKLDELDITKIAQEIIEKPHTEKELIDTLWDNGNSIFGEFYDKNFSYFIEDIYTEKRKIMFPQTIVKEHIMPRIIFDMESLKERPLQEWPEPQRTEMKNKIYDKFNIPKGQRFGLEIDHIIPRSEGGKTVFENLRVVTMKENREKGKKIIE